MQSGFEISVALIDWDHCVAGQLVYYRPAKYRCGASRWAGTDGLRRAAPRRFR